MTKNCLSVTCAWIVRHRDLLLIGPTGTFNSCLAGTFAERALTLIINKGSVKGSHDLIGEPT